MRILGIEFGSWSVKAVEMESRFRRLEVLEFHEVRLPLRIDEPIEVYRQAIAQLLARLPTHPEKIITALPHNQTALRFLRIPIRKRKQVEQMFRFELEDSVPFKLDESIVEHQVNINREGSLVVTAVSPKRNIQAYLDWLKQVGVETDWLCFEGMGLINLALLANAEAEEEQKPSGPILLMDIGHGKTNISVINEDRVEFFRTITWGGAQVNHSIAINMGVSLEEAEEMKLSRVNLGGGSGSDDLDQAVRQPFSSFLADINHTLVAYRNQAKQEIAAIRLTGGTSKLKGIEVFLEEALNTPTLKFRPFETIELKEDLKKTVDQYRFSESWGRALVFTRKAPLLFNFRQGDLSKQTSLNEVTNILRNPSIIRLAQYAGILCLILFFHVTIASYLAEEELGKANEELKKVFQDTFRSVPTKTRNNLLANPADLKKFIDQKNNELEQKLKMLSKTKTSMLRMLSGITGCFPKTVRVDVNDLSLDDSSFSIDGVVYDNSDLSPVTENLKKIASFSDVTLQREGQRFTYRGKVRVK
jgi:type IV pilus assembly protein PilM